MLIFILQTIWLYIKELAGKDLDIVVILKFLIYFMPKLIPLVLPLTILLSSIMVFGSFAENYEFAAMKSTGISLQRAMSGLSVFIVILAITTFFFSNNVIPWAELNSYNLRTNIAKLKPAMLLVEGQFNEVGTYNIKFAHKTGDRGQYLNDVTIHIKGKNGRTNATVIKSKTGELASDKHSNVLKLILSDGYYYSDVVAKKLKDRKKKPFAKSSFDTKIINIDLSQINNVNFDEKSKTDRYTMLDVIGLNKSIDSLVKNTEYDNSIFAKNLKQRSSVYTTIAIPSKKNTENYTGNLLDLFNTKRKVELIDVTSRAFKNSKQIIKSKENSYKIHHEQLNRHIISLHEKYALGFACVILFFVGAPLGALIRKGGIGLPMVIAILLFLTYHFIGIFATNSAKKGGFNPVLASWFSTLVMLPLGIFLTRRATADKGILDFDNIIEPLKKFFKIKEKNHTDYKFLAAYKNDELINLINNYKALKHDENCRFEALKVLKLRGNTIPELRNKGLIINENYEITENIIETDYKPHSKFAIILYSIATVLLILFFVFKNNKLPSLASASIQLSGVSIILFIIYYVKSLINIFKFYKYTINKKKTPSIIFIIIGCPLYPIIYFFFKQKLKEDLKHNSLKSLK